jgi:MscS family membrane protein
LESPISVLLGLLGIFCALNALQLSELARYYIDLAATACFSLVLFWGLFRAFSALLDHLQTVARERQLGIAPFMPWLKKTLIVLFVIIGVLLIAQSFGANVRAFLAGLGIGGLAFALAAQDTLANLFGSIVVAIDQPFKIGESVQIGSYAGTVEDIGLRSTRLRLGDTSLVAIPNKTVATEAIINLTYLTQRNVDQAIGLPYGTPPEKVTAILDDIRQIILGEEDVAPASVMVYFRSFGASSLDIWFNFVIKNPDDKKHRALRERVNLAIMRAVTARGVALAFPTQTIMLDGAAAKQMAEKKG